MTKKKVFIFFILILAIASFFRLWQLNSIPPGLYPDEAINGNDAIFALENDQYKLFYPENNGREGFFINLIALSFKIFGVHIWSLKLIGALIGILTVLGLYFLTKELFNSRYLALLSSYFLAISFWHVNFSRIGFRGIMVPFCLIWSFYFLFKALNLRQIHKSNAITSLALSGFFFGLGFHTYIAFRVAVIILIIPIIMILIKFWKGARSHFWQYGVWPLMIIAVALPIGIYFLQNPQDFIGRAGGVSVFSQESPLKSMALSIIKTLGMFNIAGDQNWRHNFAGSSQLFWPIGILFLIGFIISIKNLIGLIKKKSFSHLFFAHLLLIFWFFVMLLPAILTYEAIPHALRCIGAIPVCYIFAALGFIWLFKKLKQLFVLKKLNLSLVYCLLIVILFGVGFAQYDKYFIDWARQPDVENAFAKNYVEIGGYLNNLSPEITRYVIVNQPGVLVKNIPMPAQTVMFIEKIKSLGSRGTDIKQETKYLLPEEIDKIGFYEKMMVIPLQYDIEIFRKLKEKFPQGKVKFQESFWVFEIK